MHPLIVALYAIGTVIGAPLPGRQGAVTRDTQRIVTQGPARWGSTQSAQRNVIVRGSKPDAPFGLIVEVLALPDGGVVVIDGKGANGTALLVFDSLGRFVRQLGRQGSGPGEYSATAGEFDLAVQPDGTFLLYDAGNHRIDRWSRDGTVLRSLLLPDGNCLPALMPVVAGAGDDLYVCARIANHRSKEAFERTNYGYIRMTAAGAVADTIAPPPGLRAFNVSVWANQDFWFLTRDGIVKVSSDRFGFMIARRTDSTVIAVTRPHVDVPFNPGERSEQLAFLKWSAALAPGFDVASALPTVKPVFQYATVDGDHRVWLHEHVAAVKVAPYPSADGSYAVAPPVFHFMEPPIFAAFALTGAFLGEVRFSNGVQLISFAGDGAWATMAAATGEPLLVRWHYNTGQPRARQ